MPKAQSWDSEANEVKSNWVKWNVPMEDKVFGTLTAKHQIKSTMEGKIGELVWVYDMKMDEGSFHALDDSKKIIPEAILIQRGEMYSIGGKAGIDAQMKNIKVGQKVGLKFIDETPNKKKGLNPSKNIKVYAPKNDDGTPMMDEEFLAENQTLEDYAKN